MVSVVGLVLLGVVLAVHTLVATVLSRYFRLQLKTQIGWVIYTLLIVPVVLLVLTLITGNVVPDLGLARGTVIGLLIGMPLALGFTIDTLYVPPPEEYDLPEPTDG
jgi:hypothetical protein